MTVVFVTHLRARDYHHVLNMSEVVDINDDELRNQLERYGVKIGPITKTTRNLYVKKLRGFLNPSNNQKKTSTPKSKNEREFSAKMSPKNSIDSSDILFKEKKRSTKEELDNYSKSRNVEFGNVVIDSPASCMSDLAFSIENSLISIKSNNQTNGDELNSSKPINEKATFKNSSPRKYFESPKKSTINFQKMSLPFSKETSIASTPFYKKTNLFNIEDHSQSPDYIKKTDNILLRRSLHEENKTDSFKFKNDPIKFNENIVEGKLIDNDSVKFPSLVKLRDYSKDKIIANSVKQPYNMRFFGSTTKSNISNNPYTNVVNTLSPESKKNRIVLAICITALIIASLGTLWTFYEVLNFKSSNKSEWFDRLPSDKESKNRQYVLLNCIIEKLSYLKGFEDCSLIDSSFQTVSQIGDQCQTLIPLEQVKFIKKEMDNILKFIHDNPSLSIQTFDINKKPSKSPSETFYFSSSLSYKPFKCKITLLFNTIYNVLIIPITSLIGIFIFLKIYLYHKKIKSNENIRVLNIVSKVIDILHKQHMGWCKDKSLHPFIPISQVKDMLIPIYSRGISDYIWKKVVSHITNNESRIRTESQQIIGQVFKVWRWIGVAAYDKHKIRNNNNNENYWMDSAIGDIDKACRISHVSSKCCLKIRCMLDSCSCETDIFWKDRIVDAIIEQCDLIDSRVLYINIEESNNEACVYVKFDSNESADKSFRSMEGKYFEGRLITVKFITLDRYHERFPQSINCNQPLKSSKRFPFSIYQFREFSDRE